MRLFGKSKNKISDIGRDILWDKIVNHIFRVIDFDRSDTVIENNQVIAKSSIRPYGYLLVESPILKQRVRLPIIHRDDFVLAASVFDIPKWADYIKTDELLVVYSPKVLIKYGLSGSPHHVLHYILAPHGTLSSYYSIDNNIHLTKSEPQKLFGQFVYEGLIKVKIIPEPKL